MHAFAQEAESLESSGQTFLIDKWATAPSRSGITAVMQDGCLLEKVCDCKNCTVGTASGSHPLIASAGSRQHLFGARHVDARESNGNEQQR